LQSVSPALAEYTRTALLGGLWSDADLSTRDRSIVTLSSLIAKHQMTALPYYLNRALDSGVTPAEISEIITHLAFYAGWPNAMAAVSAAKNVFDERGIEADQLPQASPNLLPIDEIAEKSRAASVEANVGPISESLVRYTGDVLFHDLWLRPDLAPRDRSLVTVSALVATGQTAQIPYHLNRAVDNGLTKKEAGGVLVQLAFYAGWPSAFSAVPAFKGVFDERAKK
jgi:4-carboxymuconolactone decarboxylase